MGGADLKTKLTAAPALRYRPRLMSLNPALVRLLACPKCKGHVQVDEPAAQIRCPGCRLTYPILRGVPLLLLSQAKPS